MSFVSGPFFLFVLLVIVVYFLAPLQRRISVLLAASIIFYLIVSPQHIFVIIFIIAVSYGAGIGIEVWEGKKKLIGFLSGIILVCGTLILFKYVDFVIENTVFVARLFHRTLAFKEFRLILPLGLSFYALQALSYVTEVYRGNIRAERHLGIYALYIMFFPKLAAGPIEKPQNLLPQFYSSQPLEYQRVADGIKMIVWGVFQKLVIADRLALFVAPVFAHPQSYQGVSFIIATLFFTFQLFCDFSGYTYIALGIAQIFGFRLTNNFNHPFFARSVSEFWRRWHISFSTWLYDYIYTPLVIRLRQGGIVGVMVSLLITFFVCGLWHGSSWNFIILGMLHGIVLCFEAGSRKFIKKIYSMFPPRAINLLFLIVTFCFINLTFIFFRAETVRDARYIISHLFSGVGGFFNQIIFSAHPYKSAEVMSEIVYMGRAPREFFIAVSGIISVLIIHVVQERFGSIIALVSQKPFWMRWLMYYMLVSGILFLGVFNYTDFVYFQF